MKSISPQIKKALPVALAFVIGLFGGIGVSHKASAEANPQPKGTAVMEVTNSKGIRTCDIYTSAEETNGIADAVKLYAKEKGCQIKVFWNEKFGNDEVKVIPTPQPAAPKADTHVAPAPATQTATPVAQAKTS